MLDFDSEVARQPGELQKFASARLPSAHRGSIFVGAGDSYAAALAGFYASKGRVIAMDPYALATDPLAAEGVDVFFISVSGMTSSNILAASKVRNHAKRTVALTAVGQSQLTKEVDEVVKLPIEYVPKRPGFLSFCLSALAVLKLAGVAGPCDYQGMFDAANKDNESLMITGGTTYFLGNSLAHAAAVYSAAKVYEILGKHAQAEALEEFSHMELFSLKSSDSVNVFAALDPNGMSRKLGKALAKGGFSSRILPARGRSAEESFFHCVFSSQLWCLAEAEKMGLGKPRFLAGNRRLFVSDSMIY